METADFAIIYQDHHLLVVNKPTGIVIHPTYKHADGTMWDALLVYLAQQGQDDWQPADLPDEPQWRQAPQDIQEMLRQKRIQRLWKEEGLLPRPCLLHRLDKDTSGVVALARTERARRHIVSQFYDHTIVKRYIAIVHERAYDCIQPHSLFTATRQRADGTSIQVDSSMAFSSLESDELVLDGPLQRDPEERRRCIVGPDGQDATTIVRVLAVENGFALLEVHPVTGRTHQIRAHLAAFGHAIIGDQNYSPHNEVGTLRRQFLHAYSLALRCYPNNTLCTFVAPLASDLVAWMKCYTPASLNVLMELS